LLCIILEQTFMHLPLMIGAYLSFSLMKVPDLSIESAYVVGALCGSRVLMHSQAVPMIMQIIMVLVCSLLGGAIVGLTSSFITQRIKVPHLLSSIITFGLFHGINQFFSSAYVSLGGYANPLDFLAINQQNPELPMLIIIALIALVLGHFFLKTQLGYSLAVYGNNSNFFTHYGISTAYVFSLGIIIANALSGLSGYLFAQSNNFVELNVGLGKALLCITALILGRSIIKTKKLASILIPLAGTSAYFALQQLLLKIGFNLKYFTAMQALVVLVILAYTYRDKKHADLSDNLGV
jgi:putative ABC transport system permease protein